MDSIFILLSHFGLLLDLSFYHDLPLFSLARHVAHDPLFKGYQLVDNLKFGYLQRAQLSLDLFAFHCDEDAELTVLIDSFIEYWGIV